MEEYELIKLLRERSEIGYRYLVDSHRMRIYNTILNILQDTDEADDTAQDVFIQVYHTISTFKAESSLTTWLYKIAIRKALDKLRQRKNRALLLKAIPFWMPNDRGSQPANFYHPGIALEHKEKAAALFSAIDKLPAQQKIAFTLVKVQGMKYEEVCGIMQKGTKAIESLISRAKQNLQKQLQFYKHT